MLMVSLSFTSIYVRFLVRYGITYHHHMVGVVIPHLKWRFQVRFYSTTQFNRAIWVCLPICVHVHILYACVCVCEWQSERGKCVGLIWHGCFADTLWMVTKETQKRILLKKKTWWQTVTSGVQTQILNLSTHQGSLTMRATHMAWHLRFTALPCSRAKCFWLHTTSVSCPHFSKAWPCQCQGKKKDQ